MDKTHGQGTIRFGKTNLLSVSFNKKVSEANWWVLTCGFPTCVQANGNWYEGAWREGEKNGNGKFYYSDKGQILEGFWVDGVAKCGTLSDFQRSEAPTPTKYSIPQVNFFK